MAGTTALVKRSAEQALMLPPPLPKRIKRPAKVLDEETYTSALSHIIARDFFPGLLQTESQQDYLDALDAGDDEWIEEAEKRVREVLSTPYSGRRGVNMTSSGIGGETPRGWRGGTPLQTPSRNSLATPARSTAGESSNNKDLDKVDLNLSLSAFQAKYTSEDNESFNKVLDRQNEKRQDKYRWLWNGNKIPSARQIAQAAREQKLLKQAEAANHDRNAQSSSSSSQALILRPSEDQDARPASISYGPQNPRNSFMFSATSIDETHPHLQLSQDAAEARSRAAPKAVSYSSTRLPNTFQDTESSEEADDASTTASAIDSALRGHPRHRATSTIAESDFDGDSSETPRVNGYAFVDEEPTPSELGHPPSPPSASQQARTKKGGDPNLLKQLIEAQNIHSLIGSAEEGNSSAPSRFSIAESSAREKIHHRLVDKHLAANRASDRLKALQSAGSLSATPKFLSSPVVSRTPFSSETPVSAAARRRKLQAGSLTPAARGLYERIGKTPLRSSQSSGEGTHAFDSPSRGSSSGSKSERTPRISGVRSSRPT